MTIAFRRVMAPRDVTEEHRAATPLELFFDLCFVVAVAQAAGRLHHALAEGHVSEGVIGYLMVFFAIWWAWMNFTWFASAYDTDDIPYRLAVLVQIVGVLILAAGVPRAFDDRDFTIATLGYVVMRVASVAQWLRAAAADLEGRQAARRYAMGITVCQIGWVAMLALPEQSRVWGWLVLVPAELLIPMWAERHYSTPWHPSHIAERYSLFTLIVLGESVLAATMAVQVVVDAGTALGDVLAIAAGGLLAVFGMWWLYFSTPTETRLSRARSSLDESPRTAFVWGYGHYVIFAAAAAVGAGLQVAVDQATGVAHISERAAAAAVAIPVALYILSVFEIHSRPYKTRVAQIAAYPAAAALVIAAVFVAQPVLAIGLVVAGLLAWLLAVSR